jgi:hypothetical protein
MLFDGIPWEILGKPPLQQTLSNLQDPRPYQVNFIKVQLGNDKRGTTLKSTIPGIVLL